MELVGDAGIQAARLVARPRPTGLIVPEGEGLSLLGGQLLGGQLRDAT